MKLHKIQKYLSMVIILSFLLLLLSHTIDIMEEKSKLSFEQEYDRVMLYAVQCYATEGKYPSNLEYLEKNYGLNLRRDYFDYFYDTFSSNLRPDIIISEKITYRDNNILFNGDKDD